MGEVQAPFAGNLQLHAQGNRDSSVYDLTLGWDQLQNSSRPRISMHGPSSGTAGGPGFPIKKKLLGKLKCFDG